MRALEEYLYDIDAAPDETVTGEGLVVLHLAAGATGTCGVTTPEAGLALPVPEPTATGSWRPVGACDLPLAAVSGAESSWRPAWGGPILALPQITGTGSFPLGLDLVLSPVFFLGGSAAAGQETLPLPGLTAASGLRADCALPLPTPYGLSGLDRQGSAACTLATPAATAWACGLEDPTQGSLDSETVVALLCQGMTDLALVETALAQGARLDSVGADVLAGRLLGAVAENLAYAADSDDRWTCALGTYARGAGDCEDGALLLHALLLAAGVTADRLVTVFGRVGIDRQGHAWLTYRRESDGNWVALDWTTGTANTDVAAMTPIIDRPYYAMADYALTAQAVFSVRQSVAVFFARVAAEDLKLPLPTIAAEASLGLAGTNTLRTNWLRMTARTGSRAQGALPCPSLAAQGGTTALTATLPFPVMECRTGVAADTRLADVAATGQAIGGSGRARLTIPRPEPTVRAGQENLGLAACALSRSRLIGHGLGGACSTGRAVWPDPRVAGLAWPGRLAALGETLPGLTLTATGLGTDPGYGLGELPPWAGRGTGVSLDAFTPLAPWNTANMEAW